MVTHPVSWRRIFGCFGSSFAFCGVFTTWSGGVFSTSLKLPSFLPTYYSAEIAVDHITDHLPFRKKISRKTENFFPTAVNIRMTVVSVEKMCYTVCGICRNGNRQYVGLGIGGRTANGNWKFCFANFRNRRQRQRGTRVFI